MTNGNSASMARKRLLRRGRALLRGSSAGPDLSGLGDAQRQELAEVHAALERIERGIYGRCDRCFGGVELERLERLPWERFCDACRGCAEQGAEARA